jgi:2-oxoglutarate ferredoxin oxidoreductase subunit alpha
MSVECQESCVRRLLDKIQKNAGEIVRFEEADTDDAEVVVLSYGITARIARQAIDLARQSGVKVGSVRLIVIWPFPEQRIRELADRIGAFVVPEINYGQLVLEVERCAGGRCDVWPVPHGGGGVHDPAVIAEMITKAAREGVVAS